jgi:hypothetical protein
MAAWAAARRAAHVGAVGSHGVMSRKNPLLLVNERDTWFCRFVVFKTAELVTFIHEIRSALCCSTKFVEGTIQERLRRLVEVLTFNAGAGVVWQV